jgi:hypothetical protein
MSRVPLGVLPGLVIGAVDVALTMEKSANRRKRPRQTHFFATTFFRR